MEEQISMFSLMDQYETPEIPLEDQKEGVTGWIIERSGIFLVKNGHDSDWRGVCTRRIVIERDSWKDKEGRWSQAAHTLTGPYHGWYGQVERIFTRRPSWADCVRYARETGHPSDPEDIRYYEIIGDWAGAKYEY